MKKQGITDTYIQDNYFIIETLDGKQYKIKVEQYKNLDKTT